MRILFYDDNVELQGILRTVLTKENHELIGLRESQDVLTEINLHKPDLVMVDMKFGDIDGRDLIRSIKSNHDISSIPVLLVSGGEGLANIASSCGADHFLEKPFMLNDLREILAGVKAATR